MIVSCHVKYSLLSMFDIILLNSSMWTVDILLTASFVEDRAGIVMHNLVFGHAISTFRPWPLLWHWMCYLFEFEFSLVWLFQLNYPKYFQQTSYIYVLPTEKSWTVRIFLTLAYLLFYSRFKETVDIFIKLHKNAFELLICWLQSFLWILLPIFAWIR